MADNLNLIGGQTSLEGLQDRDRQAEIADETSFGETLGAAWQQNAGPQIWQSLNSKFQHQPEEGFDSSAWLQANGDTVPKYMHDRFSGVRSTAEAAELADRIQDDLTNLDIIGAKGATGIAATLLAGMADIDAPLTLATGGTVKAATTAGRVAKVAAQGAAIGAGIETVRQPFDPLAETSDIVVGGLMGAAFGGAAGYSLNRSLRETVTEFESAKPHLSGNPLDSGVEAGNSVGGIGPFVQVLEDPESQSINAARVDDTPFITADMSEPQAEVYKQALEVLRTKKGPTGSTVEDLMWDMEGAEGYVAMAGRHLAEAVSKVPGLRSLFDDVAAGGVIMKSLAYDLLESPSGRVRNNRSASAIMDRYERQLGSELLPIDDAFGQWRKNRANGVFDDMTGKSRQEFDREVLEEMNNRAHGGPKSTDPLITQAADALDAFYRTDVAIKRGRDGETPIDGVEHLEEKSGFYNRQWDGMAMRRLIRERGVSQQRIERLIQRAYTTMHPEIEEDHAAIVSKAITRRAMSSNDGIDSGMLMTLDSDGREFLRQTLLDSGHSEKDFEGLMEALTGRAEERGRLNSAKSRIALDMRMSDGDLSMMDLINTDITGLTQRNLRKTAGASALARKGITNKAQRKTIIDAIIAENVAKGDLEPGKHRDTIEAMFTHFDGGAINGGVHPVVSRAKRLANLGLLNQMGLTQLGETGAQIAGVGMSTWMRHAKDVFRTLESEGPHGQLAKELRPFMGNLGDEHLLFRPELQLDEVRADVGYSIELDKFLSGLDFALGKGQRLQGYISGFYYVKSQQQKIAVTSMADKAFQRIRDGVDDLQLRDIGIDSEQFKKYLDTVEFDSEGFVNRLNMDKWDVQDADDFATALNRYTHQVVQRGLTGEDSQWWHTSWGAIFSHLKTFPLAAMQKQAARNMNMGTPQATAMVTMGLATAGTVYAARQIINGRGVPTVGEAASGAFAMSNMTGWYPMFHDPAMAILGMNDLRFNQFGRHSANTGIIDVPPAIPTLNRMMHIPGALNPVGDMSTNDRIRALQAAPLIGNAVGFTAIFNAMKD